MICTFLATTFGDIRFGDVEVDVDDPREIEVLHGLIFKQDESAPANGTAVVYRFTGHRAEWTRPKEYKSRSERRLGKNLPKLAYGDGHRDAE